MQLDCPLVDAEVAGDLLVELASHDMAEHFEFARGQCREARAQFALVGTGLAFPRVAGQGTFTAAISRAFGARFSRKSSAPSRMARTLEGMSPWPVRKRMGRDSRLRQRRLQLEAVHARHLHIGEHTARRILGFALGEKLRSPTRTSSPRSRSPSTAARSRRERARRRRRYERWVRSRSFCGGLRSGAILVPLTLTVPAHSPLGVATPSGQAMFR